MDQRANHGYGKPLGKRGPLLTAVLLCAIVLALVALISVSRADAGAATPGYYAKLAVLSVKADGSMTGYSRDGFRHWSDAQEYGWRLPATTPDPASCDVRDAALIRDGRGEVVQSGCYVARGRWFDPYTGHTYYRPSDIDIDHVVPLAEAWRTGARSWSAAKRERFANVRMDVLSVEDNANASKGDRAPEAWKPPRRAYWCTYSRKWINIKYYWHLTATGTEKTTLKQMLSTCPR